MITIIEAKLIEAKKQEEIINLILQLNLNLTNGGEFLQRVTEAINKTIH